MEYVCIPVVSGSYNSNIMWHCAALFLLQWLKLIWMLHNFLPHWRISMLLLLLMFFWGGWGLAMYCPNVCFAQIRSFYCHLRPTTTIFFNNNHGRINFANILNFIVTLAAPPLVSGIPGGGACGAFCSACCSVSLLLVWLWVKWPSVCQGVCYFILMIDFAFLKWCLILSDLDKMGRENLVLDAFRFQHHRRGKSVKMADSVNKKSNKQKATFCSSLTRIKPSIWKTIECILFLWPAEAAKGAQRSWFVLSAPKAADAMQLPIAQLIEMCFKIISVILTVRATTAVLRLVSSSSGILVAGRLIGLELDKLTRSPPVLSQNPYGTKFAAEVGKYQTVG